jgi:multidrug efflux pump subunit AcrA (membrane-fusion protein)
MCSVDSPLPTRRLDLVIRPSGESGGYVVKDPRSREFFRLGEKAHYLLMQLDGRCTTSEVCVAFQKRFADTLSDDDLARFLRMAASQGLLDISERTTPSECATAMDATAPPARHSDQRLLYWRKSLFDPDELLNWLAPKLCFFWTPIFVVLAAVSIALAIGIAWLNRYELARSFSDALRWETAIWVWLTMFVIIMLHEFAHGLTCKQFGGEVREIGFLLLYFVPCFYCNVSDAWLFRERSKRLWVTFAGGFFQLFLWSLAVFAWRVTTPETFPNYLAFIVVTYSGVDTLFNFNPLIKLDGYYLLSDRLEVPNLHERGINRFKAHLRRWLWGAPSPKIEPHGRTLFVYGFASWVYGLVFLIAVLWGMFWFMGERWGELGMSAVTLIGLVGTRSMMKQTSAGEARRMLLERHKRLGAWLAALVGITAALCLLKIDERVSGDFLVRPEVRAEVRAPASGFVQAVRADEGERVSAGSLVAMLEIPDLASRIAQKQAEIREARASLQLLEIGERPEHVAQQRERVKRTIKWRDLGQQDLDRMRRTFTEELASLDKRIEACQVEVEYAQQGFQRAKALVEKKTISVEEFQKSAGNYRVAHAHLKQAEAERRARQAQGTLAAESELARRQQQLEDAQAALVLLEAGSRPEQIEAEQAEFARLQEELRYLEQLRGRLRVCSPVAGLVVTTRLKEKVGQYVREGDLIAVVEEPTISEIEITLDEQDVARIQLGNAVALKARALPFQTLQTEVERIAPAADQGKVQGTVAVYCGLTDLPGELRPGMSGYARIYTGRRPIGGVLLNKVLRYVRTEFWFCW